ncbi:hypothetical protein SteCoe_17765 [Stentor coeruleus]|uniref:Uncharacterized protein n=1 Tax=Stentor coeruleus TaxID=5963 RepID=A0A1R2BY94_9CILI|nr:hypothetical protein SteCoe_17765 [Stentor coeruleus]
MEYRPKNIKRELLARHSLLFWPDHKKQSELETKIPTISSRGNETTRISVDLSKPILKKSSSQNSMDMQNLMKNPNTKVNSSKENLRNPNQESLIRKFSIPVKLSPAPVTIPLNNSKFLMTLNRIENRLANFYVNNENL